LFAQAIGLGVDGIAAVMAVTIIGGLALQWPVGHLSDAIDRRTVLIGVAVLACVSSLAVVSVATERTLALLSSLAVFGGMSFTLYPLCLAHAADQLPEDMDMVALSSGLLIIYGVGASVGPLAAAPVFGLADDRGLFVYMAAVALVLAGYGGWRMTRREAVAPSEQGAYVAVPRTTPVVLGLDPRVAERGTERSEARPEDAPGGAP
jgi:MFS family permease